MHICLLEIVEVPLYGEQSLHMILSTVLSFKI